MLLLGYMSSSELFIPGNKRKKTNLWKLFFSVHDNQTPINIQEVLPTHVSPSGISSSEQEHQKLPIVFTHASVELQLCSPNKHSSLSIGEYIRKDAYMSLGNHYFLR